MLSHHAFGFFVDLGGTILGLVEIPRVRDPGHAVSPEDSPAVARSLPLLSWRQLIYSGRFT